MSSHTLAAPEPAVQVSYDISVKQMRVEVPVGTPGSLWRWPLLLVVSGCGIQTPASVAEPEHDMTILTITLITTTTTIIIVIMITMILLSSS